LEAIRFCIAPNSESYADTLRVRFSARLTKLEKFLRSERVVPETNDPNTRETLSGTIAGWMTAAEKL
jgi:hypothetical protein